MATIPAPFNKCIRIVNKPHPKGGSTVSVTDADTGEALQGILSILIKIEPEDIIVADIAYGNSAFPCILRCPVTAIDVTISSDALSVREV